MKLYTVGHKNVSLLFFTITLTSVIKTGINPLECNAKVIIVPDRIIRYNVGTLAVDVLHLVQRGGDWVGPQRADNNILCAYY